MEFLPYTTTSIIKPDFIEKDYFTELSEFKELVNNIINGSCMAMVIGDEMLWNEYDDFLSYTERIHQDITRNYLCNNLSILFDKITFKQIYFYLYQEKPLLIIAFFNITEHSFTLKFFN